MRNPTPLALVALLASAAVSAQPVAVVPTLETQPSGGATGNNLRDVALWVNPTDGGTSLLITAYDTTVGAGLATFGLDGRLVETDLTIGPTRAVAVRDGFPLADSVQTLAVVSNTTFNGLTAYTLDSLGTARLIRLSDSSFIRGNINAVALYRSSVSGRFYAFAGTQGGLEQFELSGTDGGVTATSVRTLETGRGLITGLVADEDTGNLFVMEEGSGLWRYGAEPDAGSDRRQVAPADGGPLVSAVGRVALYRARNNEGYLIAADQDDDAFDVFERRSLAFVGSFQVVQDGGIDAVEAPLSLAVASRPVGAGFPDGVFVAHDSQSTPDNLKLVPWPSVATAFDPDLRIDTQADTDGGTDGGTDAGDPDAGPVIQPPPPPPNPVPPQDGDGCSCASASVPATALLGLVALVLAGRRRRRS
ncbi:myxosortase-dependent phytase-like phosphatase [Pyxidicoccus sp. 3LG]